VRVIGGVCRQMKWNPKTRALTTMKQSIRRRLRSLLAGAAMNVPASMPDASTVISLSKWLERVGVTPCTAWRWRKKGWLKTINIAGRQYLTQEAIDEFQCRATAGEFAQLHKTPIRKDRSE
jgi:hypothetical protein